MRRDDLLDLNDVIQHPARELAVDISTELPDVADLDLVKPLEGYLEAVSTGNLLLLTGEFKTTAILECSRCSRDIEVEIEFALDEQFPVVGIPSSLSHQDFAKVAMDPDEPFQFFDENNLIVELLLQQTLLLNIPFTPACPPENADSCLETLNQNSERIIDSGLGELEKLKTFIQPEAEA